jgi:adenine-specific DNA-methyltransferase
MQNGSRMNFTSLDSWTILSDIEQRIKSKIEASGTPLKDWDISINYGIKTGLNDAFIISGAQKEELIASDPKSAEIIRPILRGRDIKRYGFNFADLWLIVSHNGVKEQNIPRIRIEEYPAIKAHLDQYYEKLMRRADKGDTPYNLRNCVYMDDFSKPKIIWGNLCLSSQFAFTEDDYYINAPSPMIVPGTKYLVAVLNSKLADWYIRQLGVTRNGGYFEYKPMFVEKLPVPHINADLEEQFNSIVDLVLLGKETGKDTSDYEEIIDNMVFNLYGLTEHERSYVLNGHEKEADATC